MSNLFLKCQIMFVRFGTSFSLYRKRVLESHIVRIKRRHSIRMAKLVEQTIAKESKSCGQKRKSDGIFDWHGAEDCVSHERLQSASANKEQRPEIDRSTEHLAALLCSVLTASILLGSNSNWLFWLSAIRSLTSIIVRVLMSVCNTMVSPKCEDWLRTQSSTRF